MATGGIQQFIRRMFGDPRKNAPCRRSDADLGDWPHIGSLAIDHGPIPHTVVFQDRLPGEIEDDGFCTCHPVFEDYSPVTPPPSRDKRLAGRGVGWSDKTITNHARGNNRKG